jgi:hypothetical protein
MQVGNHPSLAAMVAATPKFGASELKTFQDAAIQIIDRAEMTVLAHMGHDYKRGAIADMRDLQEAFKNGFPVERKNGSNYVTPKLPSDLQAASRKLDNCMGLFLTLTLAGVPVAVSESTFVPAGDKVITLKHSSPQQDATEQLESIRNEIRASIPDAK